MNKRYQHPLRMIGLGLIISSASLSWAATPSPSTCSNLLSIQQPVSYSSCQANGPIIQQCIQNNLAAQIPSSSGSIASQLQASSAASQTLAQLDFQCQYLLAYGSQPSFSSSNSNSSGGLGSNLKKMLGLQPQSSSTNTNNSSSSTMAASNQAAQLKGIQPQPTKPPSSQEGSQEQNNNSNNSINWF